MKTAFPLTLILALRRAPASPNSPHSAETLDKVIKGTDRFSNSTGRHETFEVCIDLGSPISLD
jgi:hypothetical protein